MHLNKSRVNYLIIISKQSGCGFTAGFNAQLPKGEILAASRSPGFKNIFLQKIRRIIKHAYLAFSK
jgi:hypothetical protein